MIRAFPDLMHDRRLLLDFFPAEKRPERKYLMEKTDTPIPMKVSSHTQHTSHLSPPWTPTHCLLNSNTPTHTKTHASEALLANQEEQKDCEMSGGGGRQGEEAGREKYTAANTGAPRLVRDLAAFW